MSPTNPPTKLMELYALRHKLLDLSGDELAQRKADGKKHSIEEIDLDIAEEVQDWLKLANLDLSTFLPEDI